MDIKQEKSGVFTTKNQDRVRSPEELDAYIRVVKPGTLLLVIAMVLVLAALIIWGNIGTLPVTKNVSGVMTNIENRMDNSYEYYHRDYFQAEHELPPEELQRYDAYFFLDAYEFSGEELMGKEIIVSRPGKPAVKGIVTLVEKEPYDRDEIRAEFDAEWIVNTCVESEYSWVVAGTLDNNTYDDNWSLVDVTIITDNLHPISFLLR